MAVWAVNFRILIINHGCGCGIFAMQLLEIPNWCIFKIKHLTSPSNIKKNAYLVGFYQVKYGT